MLGSIRPQSIITGIDRAVLHLRNRSPPMPNIDFRTALKTEPNPPLAQPATPPGKAGDVNQTIERPTSSPEQRVHGKINSIAAAVLAAGVAGLICAFTLFNSATQSTTVRHWAEDERRGPPPTAEAQLITASKIPSATVAIHLSKPPIPISMATPPAPFTNAQNPGVFPVSLPLDHPPNETMPAARLGGFESRPAPASHSTTASVAAAAQRVAQPAEHQVRGIVEHKVVRSTAASATRVARKQAHIAQPHLASKPNVKTPTKSIMSTARSTATIGSRSQTLSARGFSATRDLSSAGSRFSAQSAGQPAGAALGGLGKH